MRSLLILCALVATAYSQASSSSNIIDYLTSRRYSTIVSLIDKAGLTATLKGPGNFTIFAPSNRALGGVTITDPAKLAAVLKYHVASGTYNDADLYNERLIDSLQQNAQIRVNHYMSVGAYTVNGARITSFDHQVSNGVVHLIDGVISPPQGTILDLLHTGNFSVLLQAVQTAGLENFLQDQHPITLFAPDDAAFGALGSATVQALLNNPTLLASVLKYHVIPGSLYAEGYHSTKLHTFEEADKINLHKFFIFGWEVGSASIEKIEMTATNGVLHPIERVMVPSSLASQIKTAAAAFTTGAPVAAVTTGAPVAAVTTGATV